MARSGLTPQDEKYKKVIANRLNRLLLSHGKKQVDIHKTTHIPSSTLTGYFKGRTLPTPGNVQKLADFFNVKKSEIDPRFAPTDVKAHTSNIFYPQSKNLHHIPIVGEIACGDPITAEENIEGYTEQVFDGHVPDGTLFALRCKGHSMEPTIPDGSLVIIHQQSEVENGEIAAVLVDGDTEATLKRIKYLDKLVMLMPENQQYDPIVLDKEHPGRIIGKAISYSANL
ncbi:XRE family transcriptional regulator [uncultured Limosilactobacillus sp.]|uniref:LexA family transcriptional regulator n=1 Tax=uncultured Limosilactobacillus sp. TaxID=2837629 RepID=UPI0025DD36FE|nr:XRE family transcriptional regulator [uncultured Limosilactobacillus sp.]